MQEQRPRPFVLAPNDGETVRAFGDAFTLKLAGRDVDDRFTILEALPTPASEPPLHVHAATDEAWYVVDGHMTFYVGEQLLPVSAGGFIFAPRGIPHTFTVDAAGTRVLVFASPAGFERYLLEIGVAAHDDAGAPDVAAPDPEAIMGVGARYGITVVGPPHRAR